jgi:general secretion pathway protein G
MQNTIERLRRRREELDDQGGFTLIELLIVIVVLGILAAIVVFAVQNLTGQSAASGCQSDYKTVETAAEAYKAQMGTYPTSVNAMLSAATQPGTGTSVGPWLKDPVTSSHYQMTISADGAASPDGVIQVTATGAANPTPVNGALTPAPGTGALAIGAGQIPSIGASGTCAGVK